MTNFITKQTGPECVANAFENIREIVLKKKPRSQEWIQAFYKKHKDKLKKRGGFDTKTFLKIKKEEGEIKGFAPIYEYYKRGPRAFLQKKMLWRRLEQSFEKNKKVGFMFGVRTKFKLNSKHELTFQKRPGGHQMAIAGVDIKDRLIIENSAGDKWGDGGFCYLTKEEFFKAAVIVYAVYF